MKSFRRCIKAVSPVIATIIIVAIAITMSIAVAYWVLGLGSSFTKYEKIEFTTAYAVRYENSTSLGQLVYFDTGHVAGASYYYNVTLNLKNSGSAAATIDSVSILYNGKPNVAYDDQPNATFVQTTLDPGKSTTGVVILPIYSEGDWLSGMTVEVMLQTSAGKQYPKVITLP